MMEFWNNGILGNENVIKGSYQNSQKEATRLETAKY
jgi:hypothetical protein